MIGRKIRKLSGYFHTMDMKKAAAQKCDSSFFLCRYSMTDFPRPIAFYSYELGKLVVT